jgi:hypothetical protein
MLEKDRFWKKLRLVMSHLTSYYQKIRDDKGRLKWAGVALGLAAFAALIVASIMLISSPLETIIVLLLIGSVLMLERG